MRTLAYCLHGFLGKPADWDFLARTSDAEIRAVDVFEIASPSPKVSPREWARAFNASIASDKSRNIRRALIGYSMGGRLAAHALLEAPELWARGMLVSAHPGLSTDSERSARTESDERWARRFETDPWAHLMDDWNAQAVFGGNVQTLPRPESGFSRPELASALRHWSLARQENLAPGLAKLSIPLSWVAGETDFRCVAQGRAIAQASSSIELQLVAGAGHRAPWENQARFREIFCRFLAP